jgi:imidazolonepropionase-like amidohydrolase
VAEALAASQGGVSELAEGAPADLVVTDADPLTAELRGMPVYATMLAGTWTHRAD